MKLSFKLSLLYALIIAAILLLTSCGKETTCWECTYNDGQTSPLKACQEEKPVIKDANGNIVPVKCVKK